MDLSTPRVDYQQLTNDIRPVFRRLTQIANEADDVIQEAWARWIAKCSPLDDAITIKKQLTVYGRNFFFNRKRQRRTERRNQSTLKQIRLSFCALRTRKTNKWRSYYLPSKNSTLWSGRLLK